MFFNNYEKKLRHGLKSFTHQIHVNLDLIPDARLAELATIGEEVKQCFDYPVTKEIYQGQITRLNQSLSHAIPTRSLAFIGDILDVLIVAFMVAMGLRAMFIQPFKIPTGSMQPSLFGIHYVAQQQPDGSPTFYSLGNFLNALIYGAVPANLEAPFDCTMDDSKPQIILSEAGLASLPFLPNKLKNILGENATEFSLVPYNFEEHTPDYIANKSIFSLPGEPEKLAQYMNMGASESTGNMMQFGPWRKGEKIAEGYLVSGDNLFVNRFTHHFTGLSRGDIIVFNTENIKEEGKPLVQKGFYYIKRLVGLPGDTLRVRNNILEIKPQGAAEFVCADELDSRFEKIYSNKGGYHGHLPWRDLANGAEIVVPEGHFFAMGDNSRSSSDSRYWGFVPRANIVGRPAFIFWPFSRRWGSADPAQAVDVPSDYLYKPTHVDDPTWSSRPLPAMSLQ